MKKIKFLIVIFILVSTVYLLNVTNSRYTSEANIKESLDIAIPRISLETENITIDTMLPGDTRTYNFNIKNTENSEINEVQMEYYINVNVTQGDLPLTYKIYSIDGTAETELESTSNGYGPITLNYGTAETKNFKIIFTWDETQNSVEYANKSYKFNIEVNSTQVI